MDVAIKTLPHQLANTSQSDPILGPLLLCYPPQTNAPVNQKTDTSIALQNLVRQVFAKGHLSLKDEAKLRDLMSHSYNRETFRLLMALQYATQTGRIIQISRKP